jgi:hypothetical protein
MESRHFFRGIEERSIVPFLRAGLLITLRGKPFGR